MLVKIDEIIIGENRRSVNPERVKEQEHARRKLKSLGILEEERRGIPARLYYNIDIDKFYELYNEWYQEKLHAFKESGDNGSNR